MHLKYIASLAATVTMFTQQAIAQVLPETQSISPETATPIDTNNSSQSTTNFDQTEVVQQFNNGLNSLSQPNCSTKLCLFTLIRNSSQGIELLGGAV